MRLVLAFRDGECVLSRAALVWGPSVPVSTIIPPPLFYQLVLRIL